MKSANAKTILLLVSVVILGMATIIIKDYFLEKGVIYFKLGEFRSAINYLKPIAILGNPQAQYFIGQCYIFGLGVDRNVQKGLSYLKRASKKQNCIDEECIAAELYYIGEKYLEGFWGPADKKEALKWINLSAKNGYPTAIKFLQENPTLNR